VRDAKRSHSARPALAAQETVEARGITSAVKLDEVIFGHLTELNGKFQTAGRTDRAAAPAAANSVGSSSRSIRN
jgi:hypothetical protein